MNPHLYLKFNSKIVQNYINIPFSIFISLQMDLKYLQHLLIQLDLNRPHYQFPFRVEGMISFFIGCPTVKDTTKKRLSMDSQKGKIFMIW